MRHVGTIAVALFLIACGPDPNAKLPFVGPPSGSGGSIGSGYGGMVGAGGVIGAGGIVGVGGSIQGSGGITGSGGTLSGRGGVTGSGGSIPGGSGGSGSGGVVSGGGTAGTGLGGSMGTGGTTSAQGGNSGTGGTTTISTGALTSYSFGTGDEPCASPKDVSGGQSGSLGTGAVCLRTADDFASWNCSSMDDRTIKINGKPVKCGDTPPAKAGSFYYFDISAGATAWASFSWFCNFQGCGGAHPIPSCGQYPTWVSGGSAAPCADATSPPDAAVSTPSVDSGS